MRMYLPTSTVVYEDVPGVQSPHSVRDDTDIGLTGRTPYHSAVTPSLHDTLVMAAHVTMREGSVGMRRGSRLAGRGRVGGSRLAGWGRAGGSRLAGWGRV